MSKVKRDQLALDLRSDVERALDERLALFREHMRQDWQHPGRYIWLSSASVKGRERRRTVRRATPPATHDWSLGARCGRCGEIDYQYLVEINHGHDHGACPRDRKRYGVSAFQHLPTRDDTLRALMDREDRAAFADCAGCGHPWALHVYAYSMPPALDGRPGGGGHCTVYCGCRLYVAPDDASTPWSTCPGCWAPPHSGACS